MKKAGYIIIGVFMSGGLVSANGESLLKVASFPTSFKDLPFITRMEVLSDGYGEVETLYNADGKCVSGCAYPGITIEKETEAITRNTRLANQVIESYVATQQPEMIQDGYSVQQLPPLIISHPVVPETLAFQQTCAKQRIVKRTKIPWNSPIASGIIVTSDFGPRQAPKPGATSWHKGIDIRVASGTPVYATADGVIEYIQENNENGGKYVVVKHGDTNFRTAYFHLSNNNIKKVGDTVQAGDLIGISGNTGNSTGPHLHYAVYYTGPNLAFDFRRDPIDPLWIYNYMDTEYSFKNQGTKSCLHNPHNFCAGEVKKESPSSSIATPMETLPCEVK